MLKDQREIIDLSYLLTACGHLTAAADVCKVTATISTIPSNC